MYLHNETGDGKTLLDAFFGQISKALFRYGDRRGNDVVTSVQAAKDVFFSLPSATVSLITLEKVPGKGMFKCDCVCKNPSLRNTILEISLKRRIEFFSEQAIAFYYGSYQSNAIRA